MRLFCFSDTHQRVLPECSPAPDAWLFAGDMYQRPSPGTLTAEDVEFRNTMRTWLDAHPQPIYAVKGNHDLCDKAHFFRSSIDLTDGVVRHLGDDLYLAGLGWTGADFFELPQESHLSDRCQRIEDEWARLGGQGRLILMTHYPPNDRAVIPYMGDNDGFYLDCVRDLIGALCPMAVIVGHSHNHFGLVTTIGKSWVVFPGRTGKLLTVEGGQVRLQ
jgi:Icc-related predicted phosphoesterase